jgi:DNA-binding NarL/FixJ family response regulator
MNGLETAVALLTSLPDVPIILLTLYPDSELARLARQAGVASVISKMKEMHALCDEVDRLVGSH